MPTYTVTVAQTVIESTVITIDADNPDDAKEAAVEASLDVEEWNFVCVSEREAEFIEPKLKEFTLLYDEVVEKRVVSKVRWQCMAESLHHAIEQLEDAEPSAHNIRTED